MSDRDSMTLAATTDDIFGFLLARADEGLATVLVTLTAVEASSPRAVGAQMAISEDGRYRGSFSGGCIEAAIVAEALNVLKADRASLVRFGAGSPYVDIRLPCGGGIDLLFTPRPDPTALARARAALANRQACKLTLAPSGIETSMGPGKPGWEGTAFTLHYAPQLRVVAIGQGDELVATARLARFYGAEAEAWSPAERDVAALERSGVPATRLALRTAAPRLQTDDWTAFIFIFHDHDWEETLLPWALHQPHFYLGAVGSRRTHAARIERLRAAGLDNALLETLRPRVGLIPSTREPAALALSLIADIVQDYGKLPSVRPGLP